MRSRDNVRTVAGRAPAGQEVSMKRVFWLSVLALAGLLAGCQAEKDTTWDYGRSFHAVFENQKLDPCAGDGSPVAGMPGEKAALAYDRYEKAEPPKEEKPGGSILQFSSK
jgi:hypothetical protein